MNQPKGLDDEMRLREVVGLPGIKASAGQRSVQQPQLLMEACAA